MFLLSEVVETIQHVFKAKDSIMNWGDFLKLLATNGGLTFALVVALFIVLVALAQMFYAFLHFLEAKHKRDHEARMAEISLRDKELSKEDEPARSNFFRVKDVPKEEYPYNAQDQQYGQGLPPQM
jgi:hypothetical protein